ncbi:alpha/beta hydrolase [Mucilaginibacter sp. KACC 22063]|uniref:alpha/beta hydrolase n=1 Tax=Mucilaginibacter sp. KACC 22063 TaxID=3025666 RepID=UPI0023671420|nr:alpha/beta hydrolase [Mucilaginibacter sp. KACC 22063]WDF56697.1 alpha/beta hydrolase [Mucilaginibacter sp. KACC 22063]
MKKIISAIFYFLVIPLGKLSAQSENTIFPLGTISYKNISYCNDTLTNHQLDIYTPSNGKNSYPVVIWIHGGGWRKGDKSDAMDNMSSTVKEMIAKGYAIVSINYRYSTDFKFPTQIIDCNKAITFIYNHAAKYKIDSDNIALMGFSAGGHLAALLGLSNNNKIKAFYSEAEDPKFKIKLVIDYFGINDITTLKGPGTDNPHTGVTLLLGASASERPDLAVFASPINYIDKNDPPFLILHGDKDLAVDYTQSKY